MFDIRFSKVYRRRYILFFSRNSIFNMKFVILVCLIAINMQSIDCVPIDQNINSLANQFVNNDQKFFLRPLHKRNVNITDIGTPTSEFEWISTESTKTEKQRGFGRLDRIFDNIFAVNRPILI